VTLRIPRPDLGRRAAAEAFAAFALVFAGCGAIIANAQYEGALGAVGVSLVFGLIITVMVYATGHLSGAHINPAVTIAFTLSRHFPPRDAAAYITAQLAGAAVGALALAVATDTRAVGAAAAIAIGGTVGLDALFGGPVTGASMNPARSFGPTLAAGEWSDFWLYIAGPVAGGALGAFVYQLVRGDAPQRREEAPERA
jgi:aquaporin NIP